MAATGFGVWSIVAQSLTQAFVLAVLLFVLSPWKPKFLLRWQPTKGLLGYGLPLMGFNFVNYFSRNLDNLLIGKYLGAAQLGYYDIACRSLLFPLSNVSTVIGRVMFPALSRMEDDKARVRSGYTKATRNIALVTFPVLAGLAVVAPQLVRVLLGAKWERSIFLIQMLALVGVFSLLQQHWDGYICRRGGLALCLPMEHSLPPYTRVASLSACTGMSKVSQWHMR